MYYRLHVTHYLEISALTLVFPQVSTLAVGGFLNVAKRLVK